MTEPTTIESRTVYISRLPILVTASIVLIAIASLVASVGLLQSQRHAQDEVNDLRRQLTDQRTETTCRASYNNQVSLALADKVIAIGDVESTLSELALVILHGHESGNPALEQQLKAERLRLTTAGQELREATTAQRKALTNC